MNTRISRRTFIASLTCLTAASATDAFADTPEPNSAPLRFAVYGDCRDGHDVHRKIVSMVVKDAPAIVFQTGDLVHRGTIDEQWKTFDEITAPMRKSALYYPARGNHDYGDSGYYKKFTSPTESGTADYFTVNKANCHFIILDVDEHTEFGPKSAQHTWLIEDLEKNKGKYTHTFVFFHVPGYSIGSHGMNREIQDTLCPVFAKYGVRIVFTGHDHIYYHTTRDGVPYIVTGGGGAPLYDVFPDKGSIAGDRYDKSNHYCLVDVKGPQVTVQAIRTDGTVIEKFTVSAKS